MKSYPTRFKKEKTIPLLLAAMAVFIALNPNFTLAMLARDGGSDPRYTDTTADTLPTEVVANTGATASTNVSITSQYANNGTSATGRRVITQQVTGILKYPWNRGYGGTLFPSSDTNISGWVDGLDSPNVSVGYDYGVYDADAPTTLIPEGSTIQSGKRVIMKFNPYIPDNIYWFGTGYSMDSPYGEWRGSAAPPVRVSNKVTCESKDLTAQYTTAILSSTNTFDVYVPFVAHPPARSLGTVGGFTCGTLTQNGDGSVTAICTATGTGSVNPTFNYDATYGKFYYRYYDVRDMTNIGWGTAGCYGNNIPMSLTSSISNPLVVNFAQQSFAYPLTIAPSTNNPPATPTLTCSASVTTGQDVSATVTATDPNGDQVQYGVDWLNTGSVNSGWTSFVPSGTPQTLTKTGGYSLAGTYTINAWAMDSNGAQSAVATCQVTVTATLPDLTVTTAGYNIPATVGQPVTMPMTVLNQGAGSTGAPFTTTYYFQTGSAFNTGTVGTAPVSSTALGAGASSPTTQSFTFSSPGTYYYWVCADNLGVIPESNEGNNCGWGTVAVTPVATPAPTCTFTANPTATVPSTLTWSSTNATSCTGGGFSTGAFNPTSGSASVATAGTYTLSCTGAGGSCSNAVTVGGACSGGSPTGTVSATPNRVRATVPTAVTFTLGAIQNVQTSCILTGPSVSRTFPASSCTVGGTSYTPTITLTTQGVYVLTCDGVKTSQVIVNVLPNFTEF